MTDEHVLTITQKALAKVLAIRAQEPDAEELALGIRISGVQNMQFSYEMSMVRTADLLDDDHIEEHGELTVFVKVRNSTPESDGHYKDYWLRVPPDITSAPALPIIASLPEPPVIVSPPPFPRRKTSVVWLEASMMSLPEKPATFSTEAMPLSGARAPSTASRARSTVARAASTRSRVGGTMGRPSVQPRR